MRNLAGTQPRVVVITGASAGIGRATARRFAREGARIGDFDSRATDFSPQFWMTTHTPHLRVAGLAGLALTALVLFRRKLAD